MVVVIVMMALGLLGLALDAVVSFLAGDSEAAGLVAIRELDELLNGKDTPWIEHRWIAGAFWRVPRLPTISPVPVGVRAVSIPFVAEWRWALTKALEDISHEADVAARAIAADEFYQDMGGEGRLASALDAIKRVAEKALVIIDPTPELPKRFDLPF